MSVPRIAGRAAAAARRRHRAAVSERERGYSVLEAAITLPAMILLLMVIVQWAIVWHARSVAAAAAREGLRTAQAYQATAAQGQADADSYLQQVAPRSLPDATVSVRRAAGTVTVTVRASVMSVIPFGDFSVDETASGPIETFVSP
jgi:Flp pilus assembly protein TadG